MALDTFAPELGGGACAAPLTADEGVVEGILGRNVVRTKVTGPIETSRASAMNARE
jgi:hypothetical protein